MEVAVPERVGVSSADDTGVLINDFGVRIGRAMGWPPMAGRTAGVLMLSETPMTMAQLQRALDASKGSVSEMTRLLMTNGTVRRYKPSGSRQFVYEWRDDAWIGCLQHQLDQNGQLLKLAQHAQDQATGLPDAQRVRLCDMHDYYVFMVQRLESLVDEYTTRWARGRYAQRR
jgi:hypothetical protein